MSPSVAHAPFFEDPPPGEGDATSAVTLVEAGHATSATLRPGSLVAERYRVERYIDSGGMAQIFEATNVELDERVALKLAHPIYRQNPELVARFRAEARALARVRSEHVARVFDVVSTDADDPVMVMELLDGENLARILAKRGRPPLEEAVGWAIETCSGLSVAHANGIVHRDVKPENIFVAEVLGGRRTVKLLDFGISRLALTGPSTMRGKDAATELKLLGTPLYMAPEQILSSRAADPRIDIWSLGVVLFELLTGQLPFHGKNADELCANILRGEIPDVHALSPDLDPELAEVVRRCLRRDPEERWASVGDLAVALLPWAPPRLAVSVEQTVNVLRAAGLTKVDAPAVPSVRPSLTGERLSSSRPPTRASLTPAPDTVRSSPPSSGTEPPSARGQGTSPPMSAAPPPNGRSRTLGIAAVLAALLVGIGGITLTVFRKPEAAAAPAAPQPVQMRFETEPSGALVEIDGAAAGMTPAGAVLLPGRHVIAFTKPGFEKLSTVVDVPSVAPDSPARFPLTPAAGSNLAEPASAAASSPAPAADGKPAANKPSPGRPAVQGQAPSPAAATPAQPKATVKVIDDKPSTVRVIQ